MPCVLCNRTDHKELEGLEYNPQTMGRPCWLYANDARYKQVWDNEAIASDPLPSQSVQIIRIDPECVKRKNAKKGPNIFRKAANFGQAIVQHVVAGMPQASEDEVKRRLSICEACPSNLFDATTRVCTHRSCGCQMDKKAPWAEQQCPKNHW